MGISPIKGLKRWQILRDGPAHSPGYLRSAAKLLAGG